ncbi:MAG: trypsin-like serine protease [Calditrichae bacterium]|nr:trypsin-like serine protease [Calditrichia bacterium]
MSRGCIMKNFSVGLLSVGLLAAILIVCQRPSNSSSEGGDTLLITDAGAPANEEDRTSLNEQISESRQSAITRAVKEVSPAVVGINVLEIKEIRQRSPFYNDPRWQHFFSELFRDMVYRQPVRSLGSGFVISSDGYILTNDHVAGEGIEIVVTLPGGERHNAEIIGTDRVSDITLLKIDGRDMPFIKFGDSDDIMVGEWVIAVGNPFGLFELNNQPSVTVGVVSALHRDWGKDRESGRVYLDMVQTDAAINNGNSGGPLVNSSGQVIGMNTFIYTGSAYEHGSVGLGFAIPINRINKIINLIKEGGSVNREIWWGFKVRDLNSMIIKDLGLKIKQGVIVTSVVENSSGGEAGLQTEDVIVRVAERKITTVDRMIGFLEDMDLLVGDKLDFHIIRDGENMKITTNLKSKK